MEELVKQAKMGNDEAFTQLIIQMQCEMFRIAQIRLKNIDDANDDFIQAGDRVEDLIESLQKHPEVGYPMYGPLINTVTRGARLKKFYLFSAATGVGKTRFMISQFASIACDQIYDSKTKSWIANGTKEPAMFVTTEQDIDEIQTMILAFLSGVDEGHIIYNSYEDDELERVKYAAILMKKCPLYIKRLPDFALKDIENTIKYFIYILVGILVIWSFDSLNINSLFKKNRVLQARVLYFMLALSMTYLVTNFIWDFFTVSKIF